MQILRYETIRNQTVITLQIPSLDTSNVRQVSNRLADATRGEARAVVDLGALRYFDVNGFAAILQWASGRDGCEVTLCSKSGAVQALFELLSANTLVPLFQSREEAMSAFRRLGLSQGSSSDMESLATAEAHALPVRQAVLEP